MDNQNCENCANEDTDYCLICVDDDFYMTEQEKKENDYLCNILCGSPESEE